MSQAVAGYNATVEISTDGGSNYNAIGEMQEDGLKIDGKMLDATSHSSGGWEESIPGNKSWSVDIKGLLVTSDTAQAALASAILAGTKLKVRIRPYGSGTGKPQRIGDAYLQSNQESSPNADLSTFSGTLKGTGALALSTQ